MAPTYYGKSQSADQQRRSDISQTSFSLTYNYIGESSRETPHYAEGIEQYSNEPAEASEDDTPVRAARS